MIEVENVTFGYGHTPVLRDLSFSIDRGEFVSILGANGCGKTTLLRMIMGFLTPQKGTIKLDGKNIKQIQEKVLAKQIAYIPQVHTPPFAFSVMDVVLMGRTPHMNSNYRPTQKDTEIAIQAMDSLGITKYASRNYTELSGGQRQLVIIARAMAQQPDLLIMDEPASSLDYGNQYIVLSSVLKLSRMGMAVLMVTHDPAHAVFCADRVVTMRNGRVLTSGTTDDVITEDNMKDMYNMDVKVRNVDLGAGVMHRVCIPVPNDITINK